MTLLDLERLPIDYSHEQINKGVLSVLGVATLLWHLYYAYFNPVNQIQQGIIHFGLLVSVFYLMRIDTKPETNRDRLYNAMAYVLAGLAVVVSVYTLANFWRWIDEARILQIFSTSDLIIGFVTIFLLIHATYWAYGRVLMLVAVFTFFYGYAGPIFPGILNHSGMTVERLIFMNTIALEGAWGFLMQVGATWVIIFILFAGMVEGYGGLDYLASLAAQVSHHLKRSVILLAVSASFIIGSIMGGSVSNVATTGSFTIPLMKEQQVPPSIAGAIESISSTGGQILPPVMGSAAFIMADILGISYFAVIVGAIIPAMLFYVPVIFTVQLAGMKHDWGSGVIELSEEEQLISDEREGVIDHVVEATPYVGSFIALLYLLIVLQYDPLTAGLYTILSLVALSLLRDLVRGGLSAGTLTDWVKDTIEGARVGAENMAPLTVVIGMLGLVIQIITRTGFTQKFSLTLINAGGDIAFIVFALVALASIIFGLGMPTPAAYVVVAIVGAPALVNFGIEPLTAHLFVFYFALLSTITPPVALSCAVGASIADADFMDTCKETLRLGAHTFIIPFVFIYNPELVNWAGSATWIAIAQAGFGLALLSVALVGYNFRNGISYPARGALIVVSLSVLFSDQLLLLLPF